MTSQRLVDNLRARGHLVTVVSPCERAGEGYVRLRKKHIPIFGRYIENKNGVVFAKADEEVLQRVIRDSDIVHILMPFAAGCMAAKLANEMHVPAIASFHVQPENITSHMFMMNVRFVNSLVYRIYWNHCYKYTRFIHCPSPFIAEQLMQNGYIANLRVVSNGVVPVFHKKESQRPACLRDKICILFVGRFADEKRHDLLIEAAAQSSYKDKIQLIFAGNGPRWSRIHKLGQKLTNPPILIFVCEEELARIMNYCDLYVHPSDVEIEAISCLEALSCGLVPVISDSSRSATKQFALTEESLFSAGNPASLAQRIDYWLDRPGRKAEMSEEYRKFGQDFCINHCVDQMISLFYEVLSDYARERSMCEVPEP